MSKSGKKRTPKRLDLDKIDLTKDVKFNYTLLQIAEKHGTSKSMIQEVLTAQLRQKQVLNKKTLNPYDSGWEDLQELSSGNGEWKRSDERK